MFHFKKKEKLKFPLKIPKHIGIIMDGNGRWAKKRRQQRIFGHKAGMETLQGVTIAAGKMGVQALTVYAFSTENWSRPENEVRFIMNLPVDFYDRYVPELHKNNIKIQVIGEVCRLPKETFGALKSAESLTKLNTGLILNFALNYGGRADIVRAARTIAQNVLDSKIDPGDIDEAMLADHLLTSSLPRILRDPDLIIRTSGELRLSNFLTWQAAYSEFYFTDILWPDFNEQALQEAILEYNRRHRRFGNVVERKSSG